MTVAIDGRSMNGRKVLRVARPSDKGRFEKAAWHFEKALKYDPDSARLKAELEQARLKKGP